MRTIYVEGCPCEVLEENTEWGIVQENSDTDPSTDRDSGENIYPARPLVIAPDGSLVLPNPYSTDLVDPSQPNNFATSEHLRTLAKEVTRRKH